MTPTQKYQNFKVAIYARVYEVIQMGDLDWLKARFDVMNRWIKVDKVYLETHRDTVVADEHILTQARQFFNERGIRTSGGITVTINERNRFETYCYTNPQHRQKLKEVVEYTARLFDEIILDDFFFTNCKCKSCIKAKGSQSWTQFRLELLEQAAKELVLEPARAVNPNVSVVIKYPNWYEHFQGLGFNLDAGPRLFDKVYTGTETRDPLRGNQHLQAYHGYSIFRYFENLKPGGNNGGWVDTGGMKTIDRYAEQLWLTLFAKAPEITLFDFRQLQHVIQASERAAWQGKQSSFDFDRTLEPVRLADGTWPEDTTIALAAGAVFDQVDAFLGKLGNPIGIKNYKPCHSNGEDFLQSYLGMLGIPIEIVPEFPSEAHTILLTESAKYDRAIVGKINAHLLAGKTVVITSGLLRELQCAGLEDIVELEYTQRKALVKDFQIGWMQTANADKEILIPQIQYFTNDSWEEISAVAGSCGYPILHQAGYAGGALYVLTIPENFSDLYHYPASVLTRIKQALLKDLPVRVDSPAQVALFVYDNDTFIVESFLDDATETGIVLSSQVETLTDLLSGEVFSGTDWVDWRGEKTGQRFFPVTIPPHAYRVFGYRA